MKEGQRKYHIYFGWCKLTHLISKENCVVNLEAKKLSYYVMGEGDKSFKKKNGKNIVRVPTEELRDTDNVNLTSIEALKKTALNPTVEY